MKGPVVLAGFMGTGKSEVGRRLADRLEVPFTDLDTVIEREAGRSIPDIFAGEGEAGFRLRERQALRDCLATPDQVISCGGGVVVTPENLEALLGLDTVFCLTARPETILNRIGSDPNRPVLRGEGDPLERIRQKLAERWHLYAKFPRQVETDGLRPSEVVERIVSELRT